MWAHDRDQGERTEPEIDQEDAQHNGLDGEAAIGCALVVVTAMGLPDRLARTRPTNERECGVGEIVEREKQRGRKVAADRDVQEQPRQQEADRQASDVAEKQPRDRLVEWSKTDDRPQQRNRDR